MIGSCSLLNCSTRALKDYPKAFWAKAEEVPDVPNTLLVWLLWVLSSQDTSKIQNWRRRKIPLCMLSVGTQSVPSCVRHDSPEGLPKTEKCQILLALLVLSLCVLSSCDPSKIQNWNLSFTLAALCVHQGCRSRLTFSNPELTQDHVLQACMLGFFQPLR